MQNTRGSSLKNSDFFNLPLDKINSLIYNRNNRNNTFVIKYNSMTKTEQITEILEKDIFSGKYKPGQKIPSLRTLSEQLGVSTMVMHQAAKELEERGLLLRVPRSGLFIPEQKLQNDLCGFITSILMGNMENYYESFMQCSAKARCTIMAVPGELDAIKGMLEKKPRRIYIDLGGKDYSRNEIQRIMEGQEVIFCNRYEYEQPLPESGVLTDWTKITEMTLRYFLEKGHKKILFVSHDQEIRTFKRYEMEQAAKRTGLHFDTPEFQWCSCDDFQTNPERVIRIFKEDPPTAVFARGDNPLFEFTKKVSLFFPDAPKPERIGAFNTYWSNQRGQEFSSWRWDWMKFWEMVFNHKKKNVEWYCPELVHK